MKKKKSLPNHSRKSPFKLVVDQDYLPALLKLLSRASTSVDVMCFSFAIGSVGGKHSESGAPFKIAQKLIELHEKGIKVRMFTEGHRETVHRNKITADYLKKSGIKVKYGSTHAKGVCVDGRFLLLGSTNFTNQSIMKNKEANVLLDDPGVAKEFLRYFNYNWKGGVHGGIKLKAPMLADGAFKDELIWLVDSAVKTIDFSIYFFNHREIEAALVRAHERGVKVRGFIHQHVSFALPYIWANRLTTKRLIRAGISELHFSRPTTFSHSKYLVVDRKEVMLGTGNWLVEDVDTHPQLYLHLQNAALAKSLIKHLLHQIETHSDDERLLEYSA